MYQNPDCSFNKGRYNCNAQTSAFFLKVTRERKSNGKCQAHPIPARTETVRASSPSQEVISPNGNERRGVSRGLMCHKKEWHHLLLLAVADKHGKGQLLSEIKDARVQQHNKSLPACMYIQKCRKIRGLGCVNHSRARARDTKPSPHILLHICTHSA